MSKQKESPTITMTEEQLERVIKSAVKNAVYEMKNEEKELPGLKEDELAEAATTFGLMKFIVCMLLGGFGLTSLIFFIAAFTQLVHNGFQWSFAMFIFDMGGITIVCVCSIVKIIKTKKLSVLNTIFSAIMAFSTLLVAIASAVFAFKALN